jgi:hypothetical protein
MSLLLLFRPRDAATPTPTPTPDTHDGGGAGHYTLQRHLSKKRYEEERKKKKKETVIIPVKEALSAPDVKELNEVLEAPGKVEILLTPESLPAFKEVLRDHFEDEEIAILIMIALDEI